MDFDCRVYVLLKVHALQCEKKSEHVPINKHVRRCM